MDMDNKKSDSLESAATQTYGGLGGCELDTVASLVKPGASFCALVLLRHCSSVVQNTPKFVVASYPSASFWPLNDN